jgi:tetratricopeptide (TPR) repeat protein
MCLFRCFLAFILLVVIFPLHADAQDYELYIARGIKKINEGEYQGAMDSLKKALELSPENPEATFYTGVAYTRLGNHKEAEELFLKTLRLDETAFHAYFELGRLYYVTSRCRESENYLEKFSAASDDDSMKSYAARLIETCTEEAEERPYYLNVSLGGQYDDNVILEPTNPITAADRDSDVRGLVYVAAGVTLLDRNAIRFGADYNFYQSFHNMLDDFNVHYHKISPVVEINTLKVIKPSIGYSFEYTLFGGELYGSTNTYFGKVTIREGEKFSTDAIYEYKHIKYYDGDLFETNRLRSGYLNTVGVKQNVYLNRFAGNIFFYSDSYRARDDMWGYNGFRTGADLTFKILSAIYLNLSGQYDERDYKAVFTGFDKNREDEMQQYSARLTYIFSRRISATLSDSYTRNDSNLAGFDYERNIVGLFITVGVL